MKTLLYVLCILSLLLYTSPSLSQSPLAVQTPLSFAKRFYGMRIVKDEFETSAQYEARWASIRWDSSKVIYLVLDSSKTMAYCTYDAESETLTLLIPEEDGWQQVTSEPGECGFDLTHLLTVQEKVSILGSRIAQNAFGAKFTIIQREASYVTLKLLVDPKIEAANAEAKRVVDSLIAPVNDSCYEHFSDFQFSYWDSIRRIIEKDYQTIPTYWDRLRDLRIHVPMTRQAAKASKQNVRLVLGVILKSPRLDACLVQGSTIPSIKMPYEGTDYQYRLQCRVVEVIAYDKVQQRVLKRATL